MGSLGRQEGSGQLCTGGVRETRKEHSNRGHNDTLTRELKNDTSTLGTLMDTYTGTQTLRYLNMGHNGTLSATLTTLGHKGTRQRHTHRDREHRDTFTQGHAHKDI